jgi:hypothetical protein
MVKLALKNCSPWPSFRELKNCAITVDRERIRFNKFAASKRIPLLVVKQFEELQFYYLI